MLTLTSPRDSWAHHVPAGIKMAALSLGTVVLFWLTSPGAVLLAGLGVAGLVASCGADFAAMSLRMLRMLWPFVAVVALWHLWLHDLPGGIAIILRILTAVAAANFVTMTTRLTDMIAVIAWAARPLVRLGLKPRLFALAVALVIRFIPVMLLKTEDIRQAFRARSARRPGWRILIPAILAALDDAESVAEALRARGGAG